MKTELKLDLKSVENIAEQVFNFIGKISLWIFLGTTVIGLIGFLLYVFYMLFKLSILLGLFILSGFFGFMYLATKEDL